jgi:hypothetical protein
VNARSGASDAQSKEKKTENGVTRASDFTRTTYAFFEHFGVSCARGAAGDGDEAKKESNRH